MCRRRRSASCTSRRRGHLRIGHITQQERLPGAACGGRHLRPRTIVKNACLHAAAYSAFYHCVRASYISPTCIGMTQRTREALCIFLVAALRCSAPPPAGQPCITLLVAAYLAPGSSAAVPGCKARGRQRRRRALREAGRVPAAGWPNLQRLPASFTQRHPRLQPSRTRGPPLLPPPACFAARDCGTAARCVAAATSKGLPGCPCSACPPRTHTGARQRPLPSRHWRYQPPTAQRSPPATSLLLPWRHHPCASARPAAGHAGAGRGRRAARGPQRQYQHAPRPAAGHAGAGCGRWPARKPWCHI